jgi:hypothetical protein
MAINFNGRDVALATGDRLLDGAGNSGMFKARRQLMLPRDCRRQCKAFV